MYSHGQKVRVTWDQDAPLEKELCIVIGPFSAEPDGLYLVYREGDENKIDLVAEEEQMEAVTRQ